MTDYASDCFLDVLLFLDSFRLPCDSRLLVFIIYLDFDFEALERDLEAFISFPMRKS